MKRFLAIIIAAALAMTMLAACGNSGSGSYGDPDAETKETVGGEIDGETDNQSAAEDGQPLENVTEPGVTEGEGIDIHTLSEEEQKLMYLTYEFWESILDRYGYKGAKTLKDEVQEDDVLDYCYIAVDDEVFISAACALLAEHVDYFMSTIDVDVFYETKKEDLPYPGGWEAYYGEFKAYLKEYEENGTDSQSPAEDGQTLENVPQESSIDYDSLSEEEKIFLNYTRDFLNNALMNCQAYNYYIIPEEDIREYFNERYDIIHSSAATTLLAKHIDDFISAGASETNAFYGIDMDYLPYPGGWKAYYSEYEAYCKENEDWYTTFSFNDGTLTISGIGDMDKSAWSSQAKLIEKVVIEPGITSVGENAFYWCENLTSVTLPDSVTRIGKTAFCGCKNLTSINIPNTVTSIDDSAFIYCDNLTGVTIPESVTKIGYSAFEGCGSLTSITIPDGVTRIEGKAFSWCTNLTGITIPDSITYIGGEAFSVCRSLTSITIPDSVTELGYGAFMECESLTDVTIPGSVDCIYSNTFSRSSVTNVTLQEGVTRILYGAFSDCPLISITIPKSVTEIEDFAFSTSYSSADCITLTDIYYAGTAAEWNKLIKDKETGIPPLTCTIHYESTGPAN